MNSESTQKLLAMREQYENRMATERTKRSLTEDNAAKRRQIGRLVKSMDKKIRMERDNNHVLEAYKPVVELMVKTFAESGSNAAFTPGEAIGISRVYAILMEMDRREDIDIDPDILEDLDSILPPNMNSAARHHIEPRCVLSKPYFTLEIISSS